MDHPVFNVLFLCTGNSARSILAESLVNRLGLKKFRGYSAGSDPKGCVNPYAIEELKYRGYPTDTLRSKNWREFATPDAPRMDFVFTVCDKAAAETCPVWPGQPITAHWGIADPAAVEGSDMEKKAVFAKAFLALQRRIAIFVELPFESLDKLKLQQRLEDIGQTLD